MKNGPLVGAEGPEAVIPVDKKNLHVSRVFNVDDDADVKSALDEFTKPFVTMGDAITTDLTPSLIAVGATFEKAMEQKEVGVMVNNKSIWTKILNKELVRVAIVVFVGYWTLAISIKLTMVMFGV